MRYTLTVVEQLDRAARELAVDHPINNRLALILIDNATELVLHRRCTDHVQMDRTLRRLNASHRALARGKFLEGKLKILESLDDISHQERRFIYSVHQYRNEVYHVGLTHDDIVRPISFQYYKLSCELFDRLRPAWRAWSSTDRFSDVAERYLPKRDGRFDFMAVDNADLSKALLSNLPDDAEALQSSIWTSAESHVEELKEALEFVVQNNPAGDNKRSVLRNVQWFHDFVRALEREGVEGSWMVPGYVDEVNRVRTALESNWRQRHISLPSAKWHKRAAAIKNEPDPLKAMTLYQALRHDMAYLEEAITNAASELDAWIQSEVDRARGK
ncbi:MAG: hypothetical protein OXH79_09795 [Boseongicola sp.]|nr:hypothetical protein [Boseongicola sp.]